jgi:butyryl-CoA dehydrogenase
VDYGLTEEQLSIIEIAREIGEKKIKPVRMEYDEHEKFPWPVVEEMRKADLFGVYIHPNYGGLGGGGFELVLAVEELSRACGGISLSLAASALGAFPIILYGNPEQKKKYLPDIASGKKLAAFCITEPEAGSDATATKATARKEGDYYILNGIKNFCSNSEHEFESAAAETAVIRMQVHAEQIRFAHFFNDGPRKFFVLVGFHTDGFYFLFADLARDFNNCFLFFC